MTRADMDRMRDMETICMMSDDPDTRLACLITDSEGMTVVAEANRCPPSINPTVARRERPAKYSFIEHAERAAIYKAARMGRDVRGGTAYMKLLPCADCTRALIAVLISRIVVSGEFCRAYATQCRIDGKEWDFEASEDMLIEAGVILDYA